MVQDFLVGTPRFYQGIGKGGKLVEGAVVVDFLSQGCHGGGDPGRIYRDGVERVAKDVVQ